MKDLFRQCDGYGGCIFCFVGGGILFALLVIAGCVIGYYAV